MSEVYAPTQIEELEQQHSDAKVLIERRQRAMRLASNPDFKKLIMEGFCRDDAARYAQASGDPSLDVDERADALNMAQASGHLKRFLSVTIQMGAHAERTMPDLDEAIAEARSEEGQS